MPDIKDWVEPLMAAPALCLGVLDGSRIAGYFQDFQVFWQGLTLLLVVLEGSRRLWRLLEWSGHKWMFLGKPGGVWTSGGHV